MLFMNRNSGFFNRLLPSSRPSLAARAVPVPQGEGHIGCFPGFQFPTQAHGKMQFSKILNRLLYIHDPRYPVCIAIHRKPHTVLHRFAVQPRTVFALPETFGGWL